jgi:hypothetical protein
MLQDKERRQDGGQRGGLRVCVHAHGMSKVLAFLQLKQPMQVLGLV